MANAALTVEYVSFVISHHLKAEKQYELHQYWQDFCLQGNPIP